ncbi:MAG: Holliday junction branch migration protein RuvA [Pseudohongiellaceae bacterium]
MIGRIRGILLEKQPPELLVDVQGVGYEIQAPMSTFYQLPATGSEVLLHTHFVVREDAQLLFGFHDPQERRLFRSLIRVSGVGPKVALAVLSGMAVDEFVRTVRNNDITAIVRIPGIGKKTAERLTVEMRDNLKEWGEAAALPGSTDTGTVSPRPADTSEEAETALVALGYRPQDAARMISRVLKDNDGSLAREELIRLALRNAL